jgi:hypothetical protein
MVEFSFVTNRDVSRVSLEMGNSPPTEDIKKRANQKKKKKKKHSAQPSITCNVRRDQKVGTG